MLGWGFANNRPARAQDKHSFSLPCISNKWNVPVDMYVFLAGPASTFFFVDYHVIVVDASEILLLCWYGKMCFHVFLPSGYISLKGDQPPDGWSPNLDGLFEGHCPLTEDMKEKVHLVFASLFTDRAISYRHDRGVWIPKRPKGKLHCWVPTSQSY